MDEEHSGGRGARHDRPWTDADVDPAAIGGDYFGPSRWGEMRGPAIRVQPSSSARDPIAAKALWELSEQLTHVRYTALER